jgi:hypothetical protein
VTTGYAYDLAMWETFVYTSYYVTVDTFEDRIEWQVVDVETGAGRVFDADVPRVMVADHGILYALEDRLRIYDLTDPFAPAAVGSLLVGGWQGNRLAVEGDVLLVGGASGFRTVDVRDRTAPHVLATVPADGFWPADIEGTRAYVTTASGTEIYDLSDPAAPQVLGRIDEPLSPSGMQARGDTLVFVRGSDGGMWIVDAGDPRHPTLLSHSAVFGGNDVRVDAHAAYVMTASGIQIIDISDPTAPLPMGSAEGSHTTSHLALGGDWLVFADWYRERHWNGLEYVLRYGGNLHRTLRYCPPAVGPIEISAVQADTTTGPVRISWEVSDRSALRWSHVHRKAPGTGAYLRLNEAPIAAYAAQGYLDTTTEPGREYTYVAELVDRMGRSVRSEPVHVIAPGGAGGSGSGSPPPAPLLAVGRVQPNPVAAAARGRAELQVTLPAAARITTRIYDVSGRLVRALGGSADGPRVAGTHLLGWDLHDGRGQRVASGVYYWRLEIGATRYTRPLVVLR